MTNRARLCVTALLLGLLAAPAAPQATDEPKFEVLSTRIVDRVESPFGDPWQTNNPDELRGVVLHIRVTVNAEQKIWAPDLGLAYVHPESGQEDRALCLGLTNPASSAEEDGVWWLNSYAKFDLKKGTSYFRALFPLENDVKEVTLTIRKPAQQKIPVTR
jgi:hypothetical protein